MRLQCLQSLRSKRLGRRPRTRRLGRPRTTRTGPRRRRRADRFLTVASLHRFLTDARPRRTRSLHFLKMLCRDVAAWASARAARAGFCAPRGPGRLQRARRRLAGDGTRQARRVRCRFGSPRASRPKSPRGAALRVRRRSSRRRPKAKQQRIRPAWHSVALSVSPRCTDVVCLCGYATTAMFAAVVAVIDRTPRLTTRKLSECLTAAALRLGDCAKLPWRRGLDALPDGPVVSQPRRTCRLAAAACSTPNSAGSRPGAAQDAVVIHFWRRQVNVHHRGPFSCVVARRGPLASTSPQRRIRIGRLFDSTGTRAVSGGPHRVKAWNATRQSVKIKRGALCFRLMRRSRLLLPLLVVQPSFAAQPPHASVPGGVAVFCRC
ncbi:hypothetical protein M885DRAFT_313933 [Pelagophyceae sp. CCMP2097]|nr:hypothetical protein M885DRAFT_313933 [Pelagophyceae sp. CCMP2097]